MAERTVKLVDGDDRELVRVAKEKGLTPEAVAQDAIEVYLRERRERSNRFTEAERLVDERLGVRR